jgi:integrase
MFNLAIDSKLRGCDVVALKVGDIAPNGYTVERATVRQRKTGRPVKFELTEQTGQAIEDSCRPTADVTLRCREPRLRARSRHTVGEHSLHTREVPGFDR